MGNNTVTEEEIHAMLAEGSNAGVIEHQEHAMVRNVFRQYESQITSLMVPRSDITYLDADRPRGMKTCSSSRNPSARVSPWYVADWTTSSAS